MQTYAPQPFCAPSIRFERPVENFDHWPTVPGGDHRAALHSPPQVIRATPTARKSPLVSHRSASALTHAMVEQQLSETQQADIIARVTLRAAQTPLHERIQTYLQTAMAHTFSEQNHAKLYAALLPVAAPRAAQRPVAQIELTRSTAVREAVAANESPRPQSAPIAIPRSVISRRRRVELAAPRSAAFPFSTRAFPPGPNSPVSAQECQPKAIATTAKIFEQLYARLKTSPPTQSAQHVITMAAVPSAPPLLQNAHDILMHNPLLAHEANADKTAHERSVPRLQNISTVQAKIRLGNIYSGIYAPHDIGIPRDYDAAEALYTATHASFHLISLARVYLAGGIPGKGPLQARQLLRCALSRPGLKVNDYARARELYARLSTSENHTQSA